MPTYEYRCPDGHDFERFFRKISDAPGEVACPVCGKIAERRMSAGAGLLFKGSGFYLTDYGKNAHRTSGSPPKPEGGSKEGGGSGEGGGSKEGGGPKEGGGSKERGASKESASSTQAASSK